MALLIARRTRGVSSSMTISEPNGIYICKHSLSWTLCVLQRQCKIDANHCPGVCSGIFIKCCVFVAFVSTWSKYVKKIPFSSSVGKGACYYFHTRIQSHSQLMNWSVGNIILPFTVLLHLDSTPVFLCRSAGTGC